MVRSLERRAIDPLTAWSAMLRDLESDAPADFVDWFSVSSAWTAGIGTWAITATSSTRRSRSARSWPAQVQGFVVTSATLTDPVADAENRVARGRGADRGAAPEKRRVPRAGRKSRTTTPARPKC